MRKKTKPRSPGTYPLHRERQRRRILDAARKLFDERGIDRTTITELIVASGVQASTLYQYFSNKDDIVWAILSDFFEEGVQQAKKSACATSGLDRITALLQHLADELSQHPDKIRFMAQFDAMYARNWPAERLLTLETQIFDQGLDVFRTLIRDGIADGSLRPDLDPDLTLNAVMNTVIAAQRRLASLGEKVELEYGQPIHRLFQETIRIILFGLRAPQPANATPPPSRTKARKRTPKKRTS